jgi:hypothetical protein
MSINSINKQLEKGELPIEFYDLIYPKEKKEEITIDWEKVKYNSFYRSFDYYNARFSCDYSHITGFDKVIQSIADKNKEKSPLDEILERQKVVEENIEEI